jgi:hypothetical protein
VRRLEYLTDAVSALVLLSLTLFQIFGAYWISFGYQSGRPHFEWSLFLLLLLMPCDLLLGIGLLLSSTRRKTGFYLIAGNLSLFAVGIVVTGV